MFFTIARRNIFRHLNKTLIIGFILFLGSLIMTVGNAVVSGMNKGLEKNIVDAFSGDIVLVSGKQKSNDVFVSVGMPEIEPIHNFHKIKMVLEKQENIDRFLPVGKNLVLIMNESGGLPIFTDFAYVLGVDFSEYRKIFPESFNLVEGRLPNPGEKMLLVSNGRRKEAFNYSGVWLTAATDSFYMSNFIHETGKHVKPGKFKSNLVCMGLGNGNSVTDIRRDITGIIRFRALNHMLAFGNFMIMDYESYRRCLGYIAGPDKMLSISKSNKSLLSMRDDDLNKLFGNESEILDAGSISISSSGPGPDELIESVDFDDTYNLVLTFVKNKRLLDKTVKSLNDSLSAAGLDIRAISWKDAMPAISQSSSMIRMVLFTFVLLFFVIAGIMITNTLSISVLERSSEIGMMRAIGAQKSCIRNIFLSETALLTSIFGGLGIMTGAIIVRILSLLKLPADNDMMQMLYGGEIFNPFLQGQDFLFVIVQLFLVTFFSVLYPLGLARKIEPLDAVVKE